jgi:hypothetical protein
LRRRFQAILSLVASIACSCFAVENTRAYVVAARRGGVIEFLDSTNLETVGRIHFNIPRASGGFDGVYASPDGSNLYFEGPIRNSDGALEGCCWLYSIDLATLETKVVAGVWGSRSRRGIMISDGVVHRVSEDTEHPIQPSGYGGRWTASAETMQLSDSTGRPSLSPGCSETGLTGRTKTGAHVFAYQIFGSKVDPRTKCGDGMPGGAWTVDAATGRLMDQFVPDLHFWSLMSNGDGSELYGLSYGAVGTLAPVELVRIDATTLQVLRERQLDTDYWWIITAALSSVPSGDVWAFLPNP